MSLTIESQETSVGEIINDFEQCTRGLWSATTKYQKVTALLISWLDDDLGVDKEVAWSYVSSTSSDTRLSDTTFQAATRPPNSPTDFRHSSKIMHLTLMSSRSSIMPDMVTTQLKARQDTRSGGRTF